MSRSSVPISGALLTSAALCLTLAACGGDGDPSLSWSGTIDTLPSGVVRVASPAQGLWDEGSGWTLTESLRIGSLADEGPEIFGQIADIAVDDRGRILVLESQANELRIFDADGEHVVTMGGPGQGPGELNVGFGGEVFPLGDRIWVNNMFNRRWELFSTDGEPLGSTPNPSTFFGASSVLGDDGALYIRGQVGEGEERTGVIFKMEMQGDSLVRTDTISVPEIPEGETVTASLTNGGNRMTMNFPVPFVHQPSWTLDPGLYFWVDEGEGYRLVRRNLADEDQRVIQRQYTPVPVTSEERAQALERFDSGPLAEADMDFDRSRVPDVHPPIQRFLTDSRDHLWVRRDMGADGTAWEVFDPEGRFLGAVDTAIDLSRLSVHQITADAVYGVLRDELEVPYVVRLDIEVPGATEE